MTDNDCSHERFEATVEVARLTRVDGGPAAAFVAELQVRCATCSARMTFIGPPVGFDPRGVSQTLDGFTLHAGMRPPDAPDDWAQGLAGYRLNIDHGEANN